MKKPNLWGLLKKTSDAPQEAKLEHLAEEQLLRQNVLLSLMDNSSDFMIITDAHDHWLRANDRTLSLFQLDGVNYTGKTGMELAEFSGILRENAEVLMAADKQAWETKKKVEAEVGITSADGESMILSLIKIPFFNPDLTPKELVSIGVNITEQKKMQEALLKSENRLSHAHRIAQLGHYELDIEQQEMHWSDELFKIHGIDEIPVVDFNAYKRNLIHPDDSESVIKQINQVLEGLAASYFIEYRIIRPDGNIRFLTARGEVIKDGSGNPIHMIGIAQDITEKKEAEFKLLESELKYRSIVEESLVGVYIMQEGKLIYVNPLIQEITGYSKQDFLNKNILELVAPQDRQKLMDQIQAVLNGSEDYKTRVFRFIRKDGTLIDTEVLGKLIFLEGKPSFIGTIRDITEKLKSEEKLNYMAFHDVITELPNRRHFERQLDIELQNCVVNNRHLALMYLDLDRFKFVNDSLGHSFGDRLLKLVATRISSCIEHSEATVVRMGGDEFAIILPNVMSQDSTIQTARKIIDELEKPFYIEKYELFITTSIGISSYPIDGADAETLTKNADIALYRAKERGENNYQIYTASMNVETYKTFLLEKDLRKALQGEEFELYFQPRVCTKSSVIVGAEALIRWRHPEWGLVSPTEFIPLAEETGLIMAIGDWVLLKVSEQMAYWKQLGLSFIPISVNVSSLQLMQKDFLQNILQILSNTNIEENWLEIEITESALIHKEVQQTLRTLRELGIKIALDDFGTGYSSLSYLTDFEIDILKIDRSFIRELTHNAQKTSITKAIIHMAKELNMTIVAEGVENKSQLSFLKQHDCDQIQGYLFSPPVNVNEFLKLLSKEKLRPSKSPQEQTYSFENRRQYYRINLYFPLSADMTIVKINNKDTDLGMTETLIEDIGLGGLRFLSNINLPVNPEILLEFQTEILGHYVRFCGHIVWKEEVDDDIFRYGLQYKMHEKERDELAPLLTELSIQIRKTPLVPNCRFIKMDKIGYIKHLNSRK